MKAPYNDTIFTKKVHVVPVEVWLNSKRIQSDTWDEEYVVCREEEMYALMSPGWKNKKIRVIYSGWLYPHNPNSYRRDQ